MNVCRLALLVGVMTRATLAADGPAPPRSPLSPGAAREAFRVDPGLAVELVASEPQVESPVAMAYDERGRLWVVEMLDYPNGPAPGAKPEGRLKVLEDRDRDGHYETATVFADGLLYANGVLPWKGGAVVTMAPEIVYLSDIDGDGKADRREVLYEGFTAGNPQLRVSHPTLGPDGWIYVANGLRGGKVKRAGRPDAEAIDLSGRDFRFDLVHDRAEAVAGMGQYGNSFDDWGHRFVCTNRNHLVPIVLEDRYARRNPFLAAPPPAGDNQNAGGAAQVFPISRQFTTSSLHLGSFSAACGVTIYRDDLLGDAYRGAAFTCEPTGNLVHMEAVRPDGAGFVGKRVKEGVEFLATRDEWCRPVALAHGPDGALHVVDMYRAVIEHPEWMPPELKERPDLLLGKERGRIWRVVPDQFTRGVPRPALDRATTAELVETLEHRYAWYRTTAQRLLLERGDPAAQPLLRGLARTSKSPQARVLAGWLLKGSDRLDDGTIGALLRADHPRVREHGALLAEDRVADNDSLQEAVLALAKDDDARVRFQAALCLGAWDDDRILPALATIATAGAGDRWTRLAVATAVPARAGRLIGELVAGGITTDDGRTLVRELAALVGARRDPGEVAATLAALWGDAGVESNRVRLAALNGMAEGMGRRGTRLGAFLAALPDREAADRAAGLLARAAAVAEDGAADGAARLDAIRLLAHAPWEAAGPALGRLLTGTAPQELRLAAARALGDQARPEVADILIAPWTAYTPALRREVAQVLLSRPERAMALLAAVEAGEVKPSDLDALQTRALLDGGREEVRAKARSLLAAGLPAGREQVLKAYAAAADRAGSVDRGREVFRRACATCHQVGGIGVAVGPDVGDTRTKTRAMLLADILHPNGAIDSNYVTYSVATVDGQVLSGLIVGETASSLTLRRAEGQTDTVLRQDVEEVRSTGVSLMPEGMEKDITVEQMADLLTFLKDWRYAEAGVPAAPGR
jgi:putative membrane-bound dehydrogenase-like protein